LGDNSVTVSQPSAWPGQPLAATGQPMERWHGDAAGRRPAMLPRAICQMCPSSAEHGDACLAERWHRVPQQRCDRRRCEMRPDGACLLAERSMRRGARCERAGERRGDEGVARVVAASRGQHTCCLQMQCSLHWLACIASCTHKRACRRGEFDITTLVRSSLRARNTYPPVKKQSRGFGGAPSAPHRTSPAIVLHVSQ